MTALIWPAAPGRRCRSPREQLRTWPSKLHHHHHPALKAGAPLISVPVALPLRAQRESLTFPSAAKLLDANQLPESPLSDAVYLSLLYTDFSRNLGKVRVASQGFEAGAAVILRRATKGVDNVRSRSRLWGFSVRFGFKLISG